MYHFIVNPSSSSGNGMNIWKDVQKIIDKKEVQYDIHLTTSGFDAVEYARKLTSDESLESNHLFMIVVIGGDGTLNAVVRGISDYSKVTIGYIPAGSSNDLARDLKIPSDYEAALSAVLSPKEYALMDIGELEYELTCESDDATIASQEKIGKTNFTVSCGIGFDAAICLEANQSKLKEVLNKIHLGKLVYVIIALKQLAAAKKCQCKVILDDKREIKMDNFYFVATMIHKYEGGGFMFCPEANYKDKILNVCTVGDIAKPMVLRILPTAYNGKHVRFKGINTYSAKKVSIKTDRPCALHTDGEVVGLYDKITITQDAKQIRMIIR